MARGRRTLGLALLVRASAATSPMNTIADSVTMLPLPSSIALHVESGAFGTAPAAAPGESSGVHSSGLPPWEAAALEDESRAVRIGEGESIPLNATQANAGDILGAAGGDTIKATVQMILEFITSTIRSSLQTIGLEAKSLTTIMFLLAFLGVLVVLKDLWFPMVYEGTCGQLHCPSIRNAPFVGKCLSVLCGYCFRHYHPSFRLRVLVHSASGISGVRSAYVTGTCGVNPPKTTSMRNVPISAMYSTTWNEPLDFDVRTSDDFFNMQLIDSDGEDIGRVHVNVGDFFDGMEGSLDDVKYMPADKQPLSRTILRGRGNAHAGQLTFSLYATRLGHALPGVGGSSEAEPLL